MCSQQSPIYLYFCSPLSILRTNFVHVQIFMNNSMYSCYTNFQLYAYCLYRHAMVFKQKILNFLNQLCYSNILFPPTCLIISHLFPILEPLANKKQMLSSYKLIHKQSGTFHVFVTSFLPSLPPNLIARRTSKYSPQPSCILQTSQLWQALFSRMSSKCSYSLLQSGMAKMSKASYIRCIVIN